MHQHLFWYHKTVDIQALCHPSILSREFDNTRRANCFLYHFFGFLKHKRLLQKNVTYRDGLYYSIVCGMITCLFFIFICQQGGPQILVFVFHCDIPTMSTPLSTSCAHRVMVVGRHNIQTFTIICLWLVGNNTTASILFKTINNTFCFLLLT